MSHKRSNEHLRAERLVGELTTALDSAAWQAERERQEAWAKAYRAAHPAGEPHPEPETGRLRGQ